MSWFALFESHLPIEDELELGHRAAADLDAENEGAAQVAVDGRLVDAAWFGVDFDRPGGRHLARRRAEYLRELHRRRERAA